MLLINKTHHHEKRNKKIHQVKKIMILIRLVITREVKTLETITLLEFYVLYHSMYSNTSAFLI